MTIYRTHIIHGNDPSTTITITPNIPTSQLSGSDFHVALMSAAAYTCAFDTPGFPAPWTENFVQGGVQISLYSSCGDLTYGLVCHVISWWMDHALLWQSVRASRFDIVVDGRERGYGVIEEHGQGPHANIVDITQPA